MTSIEWLIEEMLSKGFFKESVTLTNIDHLQYKAEEMHKQEIIDALNEKSDETLSDEFCNNYYQETFISNGSDTLKDYHIVDTNEMIEISDEEIEKKSKYWNETTNPEMWTFKLAWKAGAKWYREQLKQL